MKRFFGILLAGLVGAGTLFTGVGLTHAEETVQEYTASEAVLEQQNEETDSLGTEDVIVTNNGGGGENETSTSENLVNEVPKTQESKEKVLSDISDDFKVLSVKLDKTEVKPGEPVKITIDTTDNSKINDNNSLDVYFKDKNGGGKSLRVEIDPTLEDGNIILEGELIVRNEYANDTYVLNEVRVFNVDEQKSEKLENINEIGILEIRVGEPTDTKAPVINSINIDKQTVKPGEKLKVTLTASDESGFSGASSLLIFVSEKDNESEHKFWLEETEDGVFTGEIEITNKDKNGKYTLKHVRGPSDNVGNDFYASDQESCAFIDTLSYEISDSKEVTEGWIIRDGDKKLVEYGIVYDLPQGVTFDDKTDILYLNNYTGTNLYYEYWDVSENYLYFHEKSEKSLTLNLTGNNTFYKISNDIAPYEDYEYHTGMDELKITGEGTLNVKMQEEGFGSGINTSYLTMESGTLNIAIPANRGGYAISNHNIDKSNYYAIKGGTINVTSAPKADESNRYLRAGIDVQGGDMLVSNAEINIDLGEEDIEGYESFGVFGIGVGNSTLKSDSEGEPYSIPVGGKLILDNAHIKVHASGYQAYFTELEDKSNNHKYYIGKSAPAKNTKFSETFIREEDFGYPRFSRDSYPKLSDDETDNPNAGWHYLEITPETVELVPIEDNKAEDNNTNNNTDLSGWNDINTEAHLFAPDGIEVTLATDKVEYQMGEIVTEVLAVKNITDEAFETVYMQVDIPEGFELVNDSVDIRQVDNLEPGQTETLAVYYRKTLENSGISAGNSGATENANAADRVHVSTGNTQNVKSAATGDNSSTWVWGVVGGAAVVGLLIAIRKKKTKNILMILLAAAIASSMIGMGMQTVNADEATAADDEVVTIQNEIIYDGEHIALEGRAAAYPGMVDEEDRANVVYQEGVYETQTEFDIDRTNNIIYVKNKDLVKSWKLGEVHVLKSSDDYIAFIIDKMEEKDDFMLIHYSLPQMEQVYEDVDVVKHTNEFVFTPAEGIVLLDETESEESNVAQKELISNDDGVSETGRIRRSAENKVMVNIADKGIDTRLAKNISTGNKDQTLKLKKADFTFGTSSDLTGLTFKFTPKEIVYAFQANLDKKEITRAKAVLKTDFEITYDFAKHKQKKDVSTELLLGTIDTLPHPGTFGFGVKAGVYVEISGEGKVRIKLKWAGDNGIQTGFEYTSKKGFEGKFNIGTPYLQTSDKLTVKSGPKLKLDLYWLNPDWLNVASGSIGVGEKFTMKLINHVEGNCIDIDKNHYFYGKMSFFNDAISGKLEIPFKEGLLDFVAQLHLELPENKFVGKCTRGGTGKTVDVKKGAKTADTPKANSKTKTGSKGSSSSKSQQNVTGNFKVTIVDSAGKIIPNASVEMYQTIDSVINGEKGKDTLVPLTQDSSGAYYGNLKSGKDYGLKNLILPKGYKNPDLNKYYESYIRLNYKKNSKKNGLNYTSVIAGDPNTTSFSRIVKITDYNSQDGQVAVQIVVSK